MPLKKLILPGFVLLKFVLQAFLIDPMYELHRDEYLHIDQGSHPAWGYLSVPPVTSWFSVLIKWLGGGIFWVKFFPALFGALTVVVVWKTIETLKGNLFACILAATGLTFSVLLRLNQLYQPNSLDVLCWTGCYFLLVKYIATKQSKWLYVLGAVFAFGLLNKYNIAFLAIGLIPASLITEQRVIFFQKQLYLALLVAILIFLPNLIWQVSNSFPVLHHMKELAERQLVNVNRLDFLKEQLIYFVGSLFIIAAAIVSLLIYQPFKPYRFLLFSLIFTLATFVYFRAKGYYAIGIYPIYFAFGAVFLSRVNMVVRHRWLQVVFVMLPVMAFFPMYQVAFPNKTPQEIIANADRYREVGLLRWEDGKDHEIPQDFADMLGWKELAAKVDSAYGLSPDPDKTIVICDNYGQAGAINFYTKKKIRAVSFNADYVNWFDLSKNYKHLIRVKNAGEREAEARETGPLFQKTSTIGTVTDPYARENGAAIFLFENAKININDRLRAEIEEVTAWARDTKP